MELTADWSWHRCFCGNPKTTITQVKQSTQRLTAGQGLDPPFEASKTLTNDAGSRPVMHKTIWKQVYKCHGLPTWEVARIKTDTGLQFRVHVPPQHPIRDTAQEHGSLSEVQSDNSRAGTRTGVFFCDPPDPDVPPASASGASSISTSSSPAAHSSTDAASAGLATFPSSLATPAPMQLHDSTRRGIHSMANSSSMPQHRLARQLRFF